MTPVERLRAAEQRLRDVAGAATPGPWTVDGRSIWGAKDGHRWIVADTQRATTEDRAYIATLAPPVALALADWLDDMVENAQYDSQPAYLNAALNVADAVLEARP